MKDTHAKYDTGNPLPMTLDAFSKRDCARPFTDKDYRPPTPEEVAQLIKLANWSQNDAAKIVGVSWHPKHGSSTIRKWKSQKGAEEHREIPYSAWRMMLLHAGVVSVDDAMKGIGSYKNLK